VRAVHGEREAGSLAELGATEVLPRSDRRNPRGSAPGRPRRASPAPASADDAMLSVSASTLHFGPGLYVLEISELGSPLGMLQDLELPAMYLAPLPADQEERLAILANSAGTGPWLPPDGGTVVVQAPLGGGDLLVTVYAPPGRLCPIPPIASRRLDRDLSGGAGEARAPGMAAPRVIQTEVVLHIGRVGDRRFVGDGWFGARNQKLQIEAFSIRPLDSLAASDIEFMGFGPGRRQTPWVTDGRLCGTRGRALPLTGFAVRLAPHVQDQFDVSYEGAFFESGVVGPCRNGDPCLPPVPDDPLEAINLRIVERSAGLD
jgi:hypothetical protein